MIVMLAHVHNFISYHDGSLHMCIEFITPITNTVSTVANQVSNVFSFITKMHIIIYRYVDDVGGKRVQTLSIATFMKRMRGFTAASSPRACSPIRVPTSPILILFARESKKIEEERREKNEQQGEKILMEILQKSITLLLKQVSVHLVRKRVSDSGAGRTVRGRGG